MSIMQKRSKAALDMVQADILKTVNNNAAVVASASQKPSVGDF